MFETKSLVLTSGWQKINVDGTTSLTISPRRAGSTVQPIELAISAEELAGDSQTDDFVTICGDGRPATLTGLTTEHVYLRGIGNISNKVGIIRNYTPAP